MGYTWLGMRKLTWEEVLQRHEKGELAGCFRLYDDNSEAMIDRGYDFAGDILAHHKKGGEFGEEIDTVDLELADGKKITAPASTRFHSAFEGGLCRHSVLVYERLRVLFANEFCKGKELTSEQEETIAVVGLLHDLCKVQFYDVEMRNKKIDGQWQSVPTYVVNDKMPYGHGEKSVYLIKSFMGLTTDEAMAIRWHMGFSDVEFKGGGYNVSNAFNMYPLAVLAHVADLQATFLDEVEE